MAAAKKISAEEFDRRFDDGEDMTYISRLVAGAPPGPRIRSG